MRTLLKNSATESRKKSGRDELWLPSNVTNVVLPPYASWRAREWYGGTISSWSA
eukprot:CAMPEP_0114162562 /NCGR_PEP_ID=MMETSP0043_2-20121206/29588_1 /TAXON_ID=464988 /ORGANISM="Hemiselmis andersenii, Strain CCMP644" /LENGTH=53 /DNA_ID=CAMNT_0001258939 /DNA_START=38 /DNA_END=199 /DNA_ORIENTATION=+